MTEPTVPPKDPNEAAKAAVDKILGKLSRDDKDKKIPKGSHDKNA